MKGFAKFSKQEKICLIFAMLCFIAGMALIFLGGEWAFLSVLSWTVHGILLLKVAMGQADIIEQLLADKEEYTIAMHKEHLNERVNTLRAEVLVTRSDSDTRKKPVASAASHPEAGKVVK